MALRMEFTGLPHSLSCGSIRLISCGQALLGTLLWLQKGDNAQKGRLWSTSHSLGFDSANDVTECICSQESRSPQPGSGNGEPEARTIPLSLTLILSFPHQLSLCWVGGLSQRKRDYPNFIRMKHLASIWPSVSLCATETASTI